MNRGLPDVQAEFRKAGEPEIANLCWIMEKARDSRKTSISASLTTLKPQTVQITTSYGKFCLLRNLYAGQAETVRTGHGTMGWFQIWKGERQGSILSPCLFNLYAEYIVKNARLDEAQAGIQIVRRNIHNLRYAGDTTLMAESEEELKSLLMKVKEESEKDGFKLNSQTTKIMAYGPITSCKQMGKQ